jgi:hypothetical protein
MRPEDERTCPEDERTCPEDERMRPEDERTCPEDERTCPEDEPTRPTGRRAHPHDERTVPQGDRGGPQASKSWIRYTDLVGSCGADCGITRVREREKRAALALAERLHPHLVWCRPSDRAPAVPFDTLVSLGQRLEELLPVRAIVRTGETGGAADSLYLLAGLHSPALCELADGTPVDPGVALVSSETYLRLAFSPFDRLVTIQEVRVTARPVSPHQVEIVEEPMAGVSDRRLRDMVKGLQGALRKSGLTLLDMAFLGARLEGPPQAAFVRDYHEEPTLWSLLFDPAPPTTIRASLVAVG